MTPTDAAQERDRSAIPDNYKWDLSALYPSIPAWRAAKDTLRAAVSGLERFKGRLAASPSILADALDLKYALTKDLSRLFAYAAMIADEDTRQAAPQGMRQEMVLLAASLSAGASYFEPEILRFDPAMLQRYLSAELRLAIYRVYLEDIARRAPHTLSDDEERILADLGPLSGAPFNIFRILSNADFPYPTVTLSDGRRVKVDQAGYTACRSLPDRSDRQSVMSAFFQALGSFSRTFGTTIDAEVQKAWFFAKTRKYASTLEAALDLPNIPVPVYLRLIDGVNKQLPTLHRYLTLRKRMMRLDELRYYDLYAPLVASVDADYTPEEAATLILSAVAPLGPDYAAVLRRAFVERWIDFFPNAGKRSGAYSSGSAYDVHPYVLLNYNGKYDDVSTLAHELGHTMHSYYSNQTQPYPRADYQIFVAEVASTFNESLLIDSVLTQVTDRDKRLSVLGSHLENIRATVFRQTQFAEFELRMHEMAQRGEPITGDALATLYLDMTRKYYGHDRGICVVDDYVGHEWSFIPHFYRDFYVFQYATSFTASLALAERFKAGGTASAHATSRYLTFLGSGGSKYPIDLLKEAGVDLTLDEPLEATMREMNRVMDEMEKLLPRQPSPP